MLKETNETLVNVNTGNELSTEADIKNIIQTDPKLRGMDIKQAMHFINKWDEFCSDKSNI